jgi:hypothetical protein
MWFTGTPKIGTNTLSQLLSRKQPVGFNHSSFAMDPLRLNWVEPGTLRRQTKRQDADALPLSFYLSVVFAYPGAHDLAHMPGSIVPHEQPGRFSLGLQLVTSPLQKLRGDSADWASCHKTQRHLIADRLLCRPALPQNAITGQCFGIGVIFFGYEDSRVDFALKTEQSKSLTEGF